MMSKQGRTRNTPHQPVETSARGDEARVVTPPAVRGRPDSLEEEIRLRAYYRYLERETDPGRGAESRHENESGDEVTDWLEAESDVLGRHATGVDADERVTDAR
jgi:hypothetical protein